MKRKTFQTALLGALAWAVFSISAHSQPFNAVQNRTNSPAYVPGEILIKFKDGATDAQLQDAVGIAGVSSIVRHIHTPAMKDRGDREITHARTARSTDDAIKALKNHPAIDYAQPNWVYYHQAVPNDPYLSSLWGMTGAYGSGASTAWAGGAGSTGSKNVYIGIIDEGIQYNHADLTANMWVNLAEKNGKANFDNDGNGYKNDIYGWNAVDNNGSIYNAAYDDHGTHVAGTIGALGNNGVGVVGVNWTVKLIAGKFLGPNGGTTADAIEAIDYMIKLKTFNNLNIVALNNSWGGGGYDPALLASIADAANNNILFVVASGNGDNLGVAINTDLSPAYPSCYSTMGAAHEGVSAIYDAIISVTAIDKNGLKASWANFGAGSVDLGAPGVDILSTLPNSKYGSASGTSMATPHVTGAIALYAGKYPTATAIDIKAALLGSTTPTDSLKGNTLTGGRLAIDKFLSIPPPSTAPAAPQGLTATARSGMEIDLQWTDNSNNESSFKIVRSDLTHNSILPVTIMVGANVTVYADTGLTPETTYSYTIQACNSKGDSAADGPVSEDTLQPPPPAVAIFVSSDAATLGNWVGNYGSQYYNNIAESSVPSPFTIAMAGNGSYTWASTTVDVRGLQTRNGSSRIAMCYSTTSAWTKGDFFTLDFNPNDSAIHKAAFYCVDWDTTARSQTIEVIDYNTKNVIVGATKSISSFSGGQYLVWEIQGHVIFKFSNNATTSANAVLSGVFIDGPPAPDFSLSVSPNSATVPTGSVASYNIAVGALWGFNQDVALSVSGLPDGAAVFSPNSIFGGAGSSVLSVTAPPGTYALTITGTSGSLVHNTSATLVVANPHFSLTASPGSRSVKRGSSTTYTVTVASSGGFTGNVGLKVTGLPTGATGTFKPTSIATSGTSTLSISTSRTTSPGSYSLTITGTGPTGTAHNALVTLVITN